MYDSVPLYHYSIDSGGVTYRLSPLTPRKLSGLLTYKKIAELVHDKYPDIEEDSYSSLCKMCLDDIYVYYRTGMKSKEIIDMLTSEFHKYKKYFYHSRIYNSLDKRCSWMVNIHPLIYFYSRRIHWRIFVPISRFFGA